MKKGEIFCVDSLKAERIRIANSMRNRGYYYFKPEYVEFLADSLITPGAVALKLTLAENIPDMAKLQYRTGNIYTTVLRKSDSYAGTPDTMQTSKGKSSSCARRACEKASSPHASPSARASFSPCAT